MSAKYIKNFFPNLFSWKEFEYLINIRPLMNIERFFAYDENKNKIDHSDGWQVSPWSIDDDCYPSSIIKEYIEKYLCMMNDMSRSSENINKLANALEKKFKCPVDAHIYVCRNTNIDHPFGMHTDITDNLIVLCEGMQNVKVCDLQQNMQLDVIMNPGDAVFIPAQYPHQLVTLSSRLSVSFPIRLKSSTTLEDSTTFEDRTWIKL